MRSCTAVAAKEIEEEGKWWTFQGHDFTDLLKQKQQNDSKPWS